MSETPQPEQKGSNTLVIMIIAGVAVLFLCFLLIVCGGPLALYVWSTQIEVDQQLLP